MSRYLAISIAVAVFAALIVPAGTVVYYNVKADRIEKQVAACKSDGRTYKQWVATGGGYLNWVMPKVATAADGADQFIGLDKDAVRQRIGKPDYVVAHSTAKQFEGCEWVHVASGCLFAGNTFVPTDTLSVWFDGSGKVASTKRTQDPNPVYWKSPCGKLIAQQMAEAEAKKAKH